jgi:hypothetical protein
MHNAAGQRFGASTLAHLLAAHSRATPKQAKKPIIQLATAEGTAHSCFDNLEKSQWVFVT